MSNIKFRKDLTDATTEEEFKKVLRTQSETITLETMQALSKNAEELEEETFEEVRLALPTWVGEQISSHTISILQDFPFWHVGHGVAQDFKRRLSCYGSDFVDGKDQRYTLLFIFLR